MKENTMLILSRYRDEKIYVGDDIVITVLMPVGLLEFLLADDAPEDIRQLMLQCWKEARDNLDLVGFVVSKNAHRRHLTPSQSAMLAVKLAGLSKGRPDLNASAFSQDEAAERLGVSKRLLQFAQKVHADAIPEVAALVEAGTLSVDKAATLSKATPEQQLDAVALIESGEKCPTFKTQDSKVKNSKEPSLEDQLSDQLKAALEHPKDSPERSDALIELFKTLIDDAFPRHSLAK